MQAVALVRLLNEPATQKLHDADSALPLNNPGPQGTHAVGESELKPAGQVKHWLAPLWLTYLPLVQGLHATANDVPLKEPGPHGAHEVAAKLSDGT